MILNHLYIIGLLIFFKFNDGDKYSTSTLLWRKKKWKGMVAQSSWGRKMMEWRMDGNNKESSDTWYIQHTEEKERRWLLVLLYGLVHYVYLNLVLGNLHFVIHTRQALALIIGRICPCRLLFSWHLFEAALIHPSLFCRLSW